MLSLALTLAAAASPQEVEPYTPAEYLDLWERAGEHRAAGRWAESVPLHRELLQASPREGQLLYYLASSLLRTGGQSEAVAPGIAAYEAGYGGGPNAPYSIAQGLAVTGETDAALDWLQVALEERFGRRPDIAQDPAFENLAENPRFRELAGLPPALGPGEAEPDRAARWRYDLDFFLHEARRMHADPRRLAFRPEFEQAVERLAGRVEELTDEELALEVHRLVVMLEDGHSGVMGLSNGGRFPRLPLRFYFFADGLHVIQARAPYEDLYGARVDAIGGVPADELLERLRPLVSRDNDMGLLSTGALRLSMGHVLKAIGCAEGLDGATLTVTADGEAREVRVETRSGNLPSGFRLGAPSDLADDRMPLWQRHTQESVRLEPLPELDAFYVQFNAVRDRPGQTLAEFGELLRERLLEERPRHLVVDVRHNGGGNNFLIWPLVRAVVLHEMLDDENRAWVITGRQTFSACQDFINFLDRITGATFVGEPSGSRPNFTGESTAARLPYSGVEMIISSRLWQDSFPEDRRPWIAVGLPAPLTYTDWRYGHDPVMAALEEVIDSRR